MKKYCIAFVVIFIVSIGSLVSRELPRVVVSGSCEIKEDNVSDFGLDFSLKPVTDTERIFRAIGVLKDSDYANNRFMVWAKRPFEHKASNGDNIRVRFLEMFYLKSIDANHITIHRRSDFKELKFTSVQFKDNFFWYDQLIDLTRHGLPVYGFLSISADETELVYFYNTYQPGGEENVFARYRDGWADLDFYKVLDYRNGYYLLARDGLVSLSVNERTGEDEIQLLPSSREFGVLGWVKERYVLLWNSRVYYHPLDKDSSRYYIRTSLGGYEEDTEIKSKINSYYVDREYLEKPYFSTFNLDERIYYDEYYRNFGFPELYPSPRESTFSRSDIQRVAIFTLHPPTGLSTVSGYQEDLREPSLLTETHHIRYIDESQKWEKRVAIPYSLVELYHDALATPDLKITADDFKKALFVNNFTHIPDSIIENVEIYNKYVSILTEYYPNHNWSDVNKVLITSYMCQGGADKESIATLDLILSDRARLLKILRERDFFLFTRQVLDRGYEKRRIRRYVYFTFDELTGKQ